MPTEVLEWVSDEDGGHFEHHMVDWGIYECPKCKTRVDKTYKYCKHCGRPVKWE